MDWGLSHCNDFDQRLQGRGYRFQTASSVRWLDAGVCGRGSDLQHFGGRLQNAGSNVDVLASRRCLFAPHSLR